MLLFAETLLTDLSAEEIVTQLAEPELPLNPENVETRCRKLVKRGDLVRSIRETWGRRLPLPSAPVAVPGVQAGRPVHWEAEEFLRRWTAHVWWRGVTGPDRPQSRSDRGAGGPESRQRASIPILPWLSPKPVVATPWDPGPVAAMSARGLAIQRSRNLPTCQWTPIPTAGRPLRGS